MLTMMGMKPVKFQSESDFAKSISTESKVFSIYAVGVVKGYKRETRVKIHTVVDFRQAPSLTGSGGPKSPTPTGGAGGQQVASSNGMGSIAAALEPAVGGQVLYFNIE
jgi:general secretion pathway protein K